MSSSPRCSLWPTPRLNSVLVISVREAFPTVSLDRQSFSDAAMASCMLITSNFLLDWPSLTFRRQPGNCDDNLGEPEFGALCVESSTTAGDAQCKANSAPSSSTGSPTISTATATSSTVSSTCAAYSAPAGVCPTVFDKYVNRSKACNTMLAQLPMK